MAAKRKKHQATSRSKHRASWRGQLRFGLVSFEVQAVNAEIKENAEVHFHLLHAPIINEFITRKSAPNTAKSPTMKLSKATSTPRANT